VSERSEAFAALHRPGAPLFLPNAWDYASAVVLAKAGYVAIGTTSLGIAAAAGKPDAAGVTREETLAVTRLLSSLPLLLTVDIESGFSDDPDEVAALAQQVSDAGAVGVNLEDGRPDATLTTGALHCAKITAIKTRTPDLFVNARTDAFWLADEHAPPPLGQALERASAYCAAGADGIFVPGAGDIATVATLSAQIDAPLNILYMPGRHTFRSLAEANVARVSTGSLLFRAALQAVVQTAHAAWTDAVADDPDRPGYAQIRATL
jgi:2-methylisocitrate lyase-like PEP mutase family enzyme